MKYEAMSAAAQIAYFSMEIALDERFSTYSGGLGILAGDTLRSAADLGLPLVAVTLAYPNGYFRQSLDARGKQHEVPDKWSPAKLLERAAARVTVPIEGRPVRIAAWRFDVVGLGRHVVPVYLLDTDLEENTPEDRTLTANLYGGDSRYRLSQEIVLGIGGGRMLEALGYRSLQTYHMNEGHAALVALELLERFPGAVPASPASLDAVKPYCVFTTHTPIPAGHDRFDVVLLRSVLGPEPTERLRRLGLIEKGNLNMTQLALRASRFVNAVAMRHGEVSRDMFPGHAISAITNGVHAETWVAPPFARLFDRTIPEWRRDNYQLRHATGIHLDELKAAHAEAKLALVTEVYERTGVRLSPDVLTLGFARRATGYKRADWLFHDRLRLRALCAKVGRLQVVYGGKAHPHDEPGKAAIRHVLEARAALRDVIDVVYVPNYDMTLAKYIISGVDIWLNNPQPPLEASGTSGMKAALNGIPSLSVLDGWWIEGCVEDRTGWAIDDSSDDSIYEKIEHAALQIAASPDAYSEIMRHAIAVNGSFFNTQRMVAQYARLAYTSHTSSKSLASRPLPQSVVS
jgi:glycogen phosphorylase